MINGGTSIISSNAITDVFTDFSKMILKSNSLPLDPFKSKTLVISSQNEPFLNCDRIIRSSIKIGDSRIDHGRIGTPIMNKNIWSVDDNFSFRSDVGTANKIYTSVQRSPTNERNTAYPRIEEESLKSVLSKIVEEPKSIKQMNLANSAIIDPPKIGSVGHSPMETDNVGGVVATSYPVRR